jgi:hypothetical protein
MLMPAQDRGGDRWRHYWDKHSPNYDKQMGFFDRHLFGGGRSWVCSGATGQTLEVAIGTGLNLPFYSQQVRPDPRHGGPQLPDRLQADDRRQPAADHDTRRTAHTRPPRPLLPQYPMSG